MSQGPSQNLRKCLRKLELIVSVRDIKLRQKLLEDVSCNNAIFKAIKEILLNTVNSNVPLSKTQKNKLKKYEKIMRKLACCKYGNKGSKKKLVMQSGGFLPILIPSVIALLTGLLNK
jgi:hypothetical protein